MNITSIESAPWNGLASIARSVPSVKSLLEVEDWFCRLFYCLVIKDSQQMLKLHSSAEPQTFAWMKSAHLLRIRLLRRSVRDSDSQS